MIGKDLFAPIFSYDQTNHPFLLAMTAINDAERLSIFSAITSVGFVLDYQLWAPSTDFAQENCDCELKATNPSTCTCDKK
mmetsp:Transcript_42498/g.77650  ORF Transcript_42498/g.77650 Transcript_42498/m.77650 type:complete len:80 (-) Transcript_42498:296-535(-)